MVCHVEVVALLLLVVVVTVAGRGRLVERGEAGDPARDVLTTRTVSGFLDPSDGAGWGKREEEA